MVIAAVGKNASGKDYFLEFISKEFGVPMLSVGDVARELAEAEGLEKTRDNLQWTSYLTGVVIITMYSGASYFIKYRHIFMNDK